MNIFACSRDPEEAAWTLFQMQLWRLVVKMCLESTQILYAVHHTLSGRVSSKAPGNGGYRLTHKNHPCVQWARESRENYWWLCRYAITLCECYSEYTALLTTVNKKRRARREHACLEHLRWLQENPPSELPDGPLTEFPAVISSSASVRGKTSDPCIMYQYYLEQKLREQPPVPEFPQETLIEIQESCEIRKRVKFG